jgi:hypothetical protein
MFSNRKDVKEDIARIDEAYIKAVDEGEFDKEGFDAFKAELKKELKLTAEDTNATNELEMQKYILAEINRFVTEIEG